MRIGLISTPSNFGCNIRGSEKAPKAIRELDLYQIAKQYEHELIDFGDILPSKNVKTYTSLHKHNIRNYAVLEDYWNDITIACDKVKASSDFALAIGGDHSIAIGSIEGFTKTEHKPIILWMDAHCDLYTPQTSYSFNVQRMAAAFLIGEFYERQAIINSSNFIFLGQSKIDFQEGIMLSRSNLKVIGVVDFLRNNMKNVWDNINTYINQVGADSIHLSLDLDVIDAETMPAVNSPTFGAAPLHNILELIGYIARSKMLRSMDLVEYNPQRDIYLKGQSICKKIIEAVFSNIEK